MARFLFWPEPCARRRFRRADGCVTWQHYEAARLEPTRLPAACPVRPRERRCRGLPIVWVLLTLTVVWLPGARSAAAQALTLPTVRLGGPPVEEIRFYQLLGRVRDELQSDTGSLKERAARWRTRLDSLTFAALADDQGDALRDNCGVKPPEKKSRCPKDTDSLRALAGDDYATDDPNLRRLYKLLDAHVVAARRQYQERKDSGAPPPLGARRWWGLRSRAPLDSVPMPYLRERDVLRLMYELRTEPTLSTERKLRVDSLTRLATVLVIRRKFDTRDGVLPVRSHAQAEVFWGQQGVSPLNVGAVAGRRGSALAYTEIAAPLLHAVRTSLSAVVSASDVKNNTSAGGTPGSPASRLDSTGAIQRLLTAGGQVNLALALPLFHGALAHNAASLTLLAVPRVGFNSPAFGATRVDSSTTVLDAGAEVHAKWLDIIDGAGLVGQVRWAHATGTRNFGREVGVGKNRFNYATATLGFVFGRQYVLTGSRPFGGAKAIRSTDWTFGLTLVRMPNL